MADFGRRKLDATSDVESNETEQANEQFRQAMHPAQASRQMADFGKRKLDATYDAESNETEQADEQFGQEMHTSQAPRSGMEPMERPTGELQFYPCGERRRCRAACTRCWERKLRCTMLKCGACLNCVEHKRQCIPRVHNRRPSQLRHLGPDAGEVLMMGGALTAMDPVPQYYMSGNHHGVMFAPPNPNPMAGPSMYHSGGYSMGNAPQLATVGFPVTNQSTMIGGSTPPSGMTSLMDHSTEPACPWPTWPARWVRYTLRSI